MHLTSTCYPHLGPKTLNAVFVVVVVVVIIVVVVVVIIVVVLSSDLYFI